MLLRFRQVRLSELCDARALIEPRIAALAAQNATDPDRKALRELLAALIVARDDPVARVEADLALHRAIAQAAGHSVYQAITESVRVSVMQSMVLGARAPRALPAGEGQHTAIVDAIAGGDAEGAELAMKEHLDFVAAGIRRLEQDESQPV